ncbi:MAG: hypothetical protein KGJ09_04955 [Candidatus Omnitrophica bacterium]|nr:hypothetical protein [Candidatus Omnitrophota bacterium]MDE2009412.1 hypothetical protein [Candidatus Omnitrophota bacterium]MDE2214196.1 hypothetical protein [Candidatus Omnitrophota bacterium]MDE2231233.1 hypothetical protein [Candidatus Omnitrophota bacterium]
MIRLFFLVIFLLAGSCPLKADETSGNDDQGFVQLLDETKNPFEDGLPKPVAVQQPVPPAPKPLPPPPLPKPVLLPSVPKRVEPPAPVVLPDDIKVQGVMVGGGMHEAIIMDKIVGLGEVIEGAKVVAITKGGVTLEYKDRKFSLGID